jgi:hypothetical protein
VEVALELVAEVLAEAAAEVLVDVVGREHVGVVDACWRYRRVLAFRVRYWRGFRRSRSVR